MPTTGTNGFYFPRPMAQPTNLSCLKPQSSNATESDGQTSEVLVCTFRFKPTNTTETGHTLRRLRLGAPSSVHGAVPLHSRMRQTRKQVSSRSIHEQNGVHEAEPPSLAVVNPLIPPREPVAKRYCPHGKQKNNCKQCGGSSICEHGRQKSRCKQCGGSGICEHGRQKNKCKQCGGGSICAHGREKYSCKQCGGSGICAHGRVKSRCKECGGSGICAHGRVKSRCQECGGGSICAHGRRKYSCKQCGGSGICAHGRQKHQCKECK